MPSSSLTAAFVRRRAQHLGFLRVLCRDEALAEELFQDLAVAVLEGGERYDPAAGDFDAWVRGIARNLWRAHLRRRRPASPLESIAEQAVAAAWDDRGAEEAAEQEERLTRLRACLDRLAPAARTLVQQRYAEALSSAAIGAASGRSPAAVDTALCRVRAVLLACLGGRA